MALALLVGCGDDDAKPVSSQLGQSCVRTADCAEGLSCIANTCYKAGTATGGEGGGTAGPTPPVLGGEGESCASRLDCKAALGCFNNRCTGAEPAGDAGATGMTPGVTLGSRGESCSVNSDCGKGLVCVPTAGVGAGVCDLSDFGIKPTGLTCSGECTADADCYQLPLELHTATVKSCEDVDDAITTQALDCTADPVLPAAKLLCFEQATYCGYNKKTSKVWTCDTDAHSCVYDVACDPLMGSDAPQGCPSYSRLHTLTGLFCNADSLKCVGPTAVAGCTADAKCEGEQVSDSIVPGDVCTAGECTCYKPTGRCYRKCARNIDCAAGQVCDTAKTKLCVPDTECDTDAQCAIANHSLAYKCNAGTCGQACATDRDCSGTGLASAFNGRVCSAGFCTSIANDCTEDGKQCEPTTLGDLKPFCVVTTTGSGTTVSSSVTD